MARNIPVFASGVLGAAKAIFGGSDDWRVRLSIPNNSVFNGGAILAPLKSAGGLVFPFTPSITISGNASYQAIDTVHQNYQFMAYQNSKPSTIGIQAPFVSEDSATAQYWIAALHFLRAATKMYTGENEFQGSPPPIVYLNGYGDHVFKNVPVVITDFSVELPAEVDYISTTVSELGAALGGITDTLGMVGGMAGSLGLNKVSSLATKAGAITGTATSMLGKVTSLFGGGSVTHVPVKSLISVTLQPMYSRESVRTFNLKDFVNGTYIKGSGGFI